MAKQHSNAWGWASDHWIITGLAILFVVPSVIYLPVAVIEAVKTKPEALPSGPGTTPFPPSP